MTFTSTNDLREAGFVGFVAISELAATQYEALPKEPGVYVVCREPLATPTFLLQSPASPHKAKDPTLPIPELESRWIPGTCVVYIGKAGGAGLRSTLRTRIRAYVRHGRGQGSGHWGGRSIWQLENAPDLQFGWKIVDNPRCVERDLIAAFQKIHGLRPFANRAS